MIRSLAQVDPLAPDGLRPDGTQADQLLHDELSRAEYATGIPQLIRDFLWDRFKDLMDFFNDGEALGTTPGKIMLLVVLLVLIFLCVAFVRVRRSHTLTATPGDLGLVPELSGTDYRARAAAAASAGNYALACLESFRALVRLAEERTVLTDQPGRTAFEAAALLMPAFPTQSEQLRQAALFFDGLRYGEQEASSADYARLRLLGTALDAELPRAEPLPAHLSPAAPK